MLPIIKNKEDLYQRLARKKKYSFPDVSHILSAVQKDGDRALITLTENYDQVSLSSVRVPLSQIKSIKNQQKSLYDILERAIQNIRSFHLKQIPKPFSLTQSDGTIVEWKWRPLNRVGVYVPGGHYPLISSLLMNVLPAQVAGVNEIAVCTPPTSTGLPNNLILNACHRLNIKEVYSIGGAQAIAALAYGTESIHSVDKIVGPGSAYVSSAKQAVSQSVGIDMNAGPTEVVVFADDGANASFVASDLISQAEHAPDASAILVTNSSNFANKVRSEIDRKIILLKTRDMVLKSFQNHGAIYVGPNFSFCLDVINEIAPEHLSLQINNAADYVTKVIAGAIFIGRNTPIAWGDYWAGPNHTLPTMGQAKFRGPLNVMDYLVPYSTIDASNAILKSGKKVSDLAKMEGLYGHAQSVKIRMEIV